ncbi:MAG: CRISPR-associated protein Cas4, partial [Patescibacteria group bacterium]|nr:CRISPR-associated protein Cas4 [Patescibacteria group bacterium]
GKLLHKNTYKREKKEFSMGPIKVDWVDLENSIIHEVKKSDKMEIAHIWQLKYYLWLLKTMGAGNFSGEINYPKLKQKVKINLSDEDLDKLNSICNEIEIIISSKDIPEPINKNFCKKCSYFELCYI